MVKIHENELIKDIKEILNKARSKARNVVNSAMVQAYWLIGKRIVEHDQKGADRATYGKRLLKELSLELKKEFGKGFNERSLRRMRQFYKVYPIWDSVRPELSWSHYRVLIRITNSDARQYYTDEAVSQHWSYRTLERNYNTLYYERLLSSQETAPVIAEMEKKTAKMKQNQKDFFKNPYVLEFLDIPRNKSYTESKLEDSLITNLQCFLLELGKGFSFVARQKLIRTETSDFYIDLVFYNYILKCFVLIDLKTDKLTHQNVGQMDMYVRMFDDLERGEDDNPTIGMLLCSETDSTIVKYSVLNDNNQLFASKYKHYLPTKEELANEIKRDRLLFEEVQQYAIH